MKLKWTLASMLALGVAAACGGASMVDNGSKTNWLERCDADAECGEGSCESGACTFSCEASSDCGGLDGNAACGPARVTPPPGEDSCETVENFCLPACDGDDDCADIGSGYVCEKGLCTPTTECEAEPPNEPDCEAMDARSSGDPCLRLEGFAFDGTDCAGVNCGCDGGDCDELFSDRASCLEQYNVCFISAPYRFCGEDADCAAGESCFAGTCAGDCTDSAECGADERCFYEEEETCLLAVVDPSGAATNGQCIARCRTDADCQSVAPGLSCWAQGCVRVLPECETRCPEVADSCPDGCYPIQGRGYDFGRMCLQAELETLGCVLEGRVSTGDDNCIVSPEGVVYGGISGTHAGQLAVHGDYRECTDAELDTWSNGAEDAALCE